MKIKMTDKVYIEQGSPQYVLLFISMGFTVTADFDAAQLVCFTGGSDVSPHFYGDRRHDTTHNDVVRDAKEQRLFDECVKQGKSMVGICRGAQFLNVMNGGRMYQDVHQHTASHDLIDIATGDRIHVTSTHHQMMMPTQDAILVAIANMNGRREWFDGNVPAFDTSKEDIEVVFYPATRCLCFQPHPEFTGPGMNEMKDYFTRLVSQFLITEKTNVH